LETSPEALKHSLSALFPLLPEGNTSICIELTIKEKFAALAD
jgi:hypothetical protein